MKEKLLNMGFMEYGAVPNSRQMEWYHRGATAFIHFGMNTFMGNEWGDGNEDPKMFAPTELDCRQWIRFLKKNGFGSAVLTTKHHDGFCLWPSAYTEHSVKNSSYKDGKGDIVREFTDACREYGMKAGIYLSPWDRHEKTWGREEYNDFYVNQLAELLSNYGEIWEVWWDGAGSTEAHYDWDRWATTVRTLQPNAVIFGSLGATPYVDVRWVGNEKGIAGKPCWATIDPISLEKETMAELNSGKEDGARFIPAEADVSIRPGWFYKKSQDDCVRTPTNLFNLWKSSLGRNAGWLLNFPPDQRGLIHENDIASFESFKAELAKDMEIDFSQTAKITASSVRATDDFAPQNLLDRKEETFYAPEDGFFTPELILEFDKEHEINGVVFGEMIELGHHIRGYEIEVLVDGEWKKVAEGQCVGYRCVEMFDALKATKLRLKITDARELPLLRELSVYRFADRPDEMDIKIKGKNLLESEGVKVTRDRNVIDINLGGIFPFNCIKIEGLDLREYEIRVFNGTDFESYGKYEAYFDLPMIYRFDKPIDWAYRIQIVMRESSKCKLKERRVEVFYE